MELKDVADIYQMPDHILAERGIEPYTWLDPESWGSKENALFWEWQAKRVGHREAEARARLASLLGVPALWKYILPAIEKRLSQ